LYCINSLCKDTSCNNIEKLGSATATAGMPATARIPATAQMKATAEKPTTPGTPAKAGNLAIVRKSRTKRTAAAAELLVTSGMQSTASLQAIAMIQANRVTQQPTPPEFCRNSQKFIGMPKIRENICTKKKSGNCPFLSCRDQANNTQQCKL
jgi:hypothetical protein